MFALVIGKREQGKSTLSLKLALEWSPRVIIFDPRRQFNRGYVTSNLEEFSTLIDDANDVVVYQPLSESDDEEAIGIINEAYARGFYSNPQARFVLLIDESQDLAKSGPAMPALSRYARKTKTDTAALILNFHRPADVHPIFKSLPTDMFIFRQTLFNDLEWLRLNAGEEIAEKVRTLPNHVFIHLQVDHDRWRVVDDPASWYIPLEGELKARDLYGQVRLGG